MTRCMWAWGRRATPTARPTCPAPSCESPQLTGCCCGRHWLRRCCRCRRAAGKHHAITITRHPLQHDHQLLHLDGHRQNDPSQNLAAAARSPHPLLSPLAPPPCRRFNLDGSGEDIYARSIRNPAGLAVHPATGRLWFTGMASVRMMAACEHCVYTCIYPSAPSWHLAVSVLEA